MSGITSNNSWKNKATMGKHGATPRDGDEDGGDDGAGGGDDGDGGIPEKMCPFDLLNS
jgi:hypothetical protein